jgi:hypothetical protein
VKFYLGTHEPAWLGRSHVPLFISAVRLRRLKRKLPRARVPWALDSGGFSVLSKHGGYPQSAEEYVAEVRRWSEEIGLMDWAAIQDWMCEPVMLARTGLTVAEHQRRTVQSYLDLRRIAPDLPWVPVLQGFTREEYLHCASLYAAAGVDLADGRLVGIGSVCRRESTREAESIIRELAGRGIQLHGFGFKLAGLERCRDVLASADSLAWSDGARARASEARRECRRGQVALFDNSSSTAIASPQNSPAVALAWQSRVLARAGITEEAGLLCCPFCESGEVHPPISSELDYCCVDCGETWGDVRDPSLLHPSRR